MTDEAPVEVPQPPVEVPEPVVEDNNGSTDIHQIAVECIAGRWGRGQARKHRLTKNGYDADAVLAEVDRIFKGTS